MSAHQDMVESRLLDLAENGGTALVRAAAVAALFNLSAARRGAAPAWHPAEGAKNRTHMEEEDQQSDDYWTHSRFLLAAPVINLPFAGAWPPLDHAMEASDGCQLFQLRRPVRHPPDTKG